MSEILKKAACYIRVSTDEQLEFSPDAQLHDIREYCKKKNLLLLEEHIYIDEGISGTKADKRPMFQKMIATAKTKPKPFDAILVHKFDRFARNREDSAVYKSLLRKRLKIDVISIKEDVGNDKNGFLLEGMLDVLAEYYSLNLSDEVKKGQLEKVRKGGNVSKLPAGYKSDGNGNIVIDENNAWWVKIIFQDFLKGMGFRRISEHLHELGIKPANGEFFSQERIKYILNNPIYAGYIRRSTDGAFAKKFNDPKIMISKGIHQSLISEETWSKTQKRLQENAKLYSHVKSTNIHWLSGLVRCGHCGAVMTRYKSRNYYLMQCSGYFRGTCKKSNSITYHKIEQIILEQIKKDFTFKLDIKISTKKENLENQNILIELEEQLERVQEKENRIRLAYINGIDSIEEYQKNKILLSTEIKSIQKEIDKIKNSALTPQKKEKTMKIAKTIYESLVNNKISDKEKNILARELINKIIYNKTLEEITIFYNLQ